MIKRVGAQRRSIGVNGAGFANRPAPPPAQRGWIPRPRQAICQDYQQSPSSRRVGPFRIAGREVTRQAILECTVERILRHDLSDSVEKRGALTQILGTLERITFGLLGHPQLLHCKPARIRRCRPGRRRRDRHIARSEATPAREAEWAWVGRFERLCRSGMAPQGSRLHRPLRCVPENCARY
jgi:hypothetical protein